MKVPDKTMRSMSKDGNRGWRRPKRGRRVLKRAGSVYVVEIAMAQGGMKYKMRKKERSFDGKYADCNV